MSTSAGIQRPIGSKSMFKRTKAPPPPSTLHSANVTSPVNGTASAIHTNGNTAPQKEQNGSNHALKEISNNGISVKPEGSREITVILPDDRSIKATVANNMPMLDLLVLVAVKNKLNPSNYMITFVAADTNGEPMQISNNKCVGDLDEEDILKVLPKITQEHFTLKRKERKASKFEQTIRLTVITDKRHRLVVRVNPSRPLLELFPIICKERGVDPKYHTLLLVGRPDEPLDMRKTLSHYAVTEIMLVNTKEPEGSPDMMVQKKKKGFFSRLTRKKKGYDFGGGGNSTLPSTSTAPKMKPAPSSLNQSILNQSAVNQSISNQSAINQSVLNQNAINQSAVSSLEVASSHTSIVSRSISTSRRQAPKPPTTKASPDGKGAPDMTSSVAENYTKGTVSHTGSLKKRRAPQPPKVPDMIVELVEGPPALSADGEVDAINTYALMTSTPTYNERTNRSPSPSRPMNPPPQPPQLDELQGYDDGKTPSKPPRPLSFEGLDYDATYSKKDFDFPPPPPELLTPIENEEDQQKTSSSGTEHISADSLASGTDEEVDVVEEIGEVNDVELKVEDNELVSIPQCAHCRNPESGECECASSADSPDTEQPQVEGEDEQRIVSSNENSSVNNDAGQTKAERQEALSRMMKLSFEVEDSNETTNCSPSPHPENDINMLEEKSLHALAYNVKRTPLSFEDVENGSSPEDMNELKDNKDNVDETKDVHDMVELSIEALQEQYITLQQQMGLLQQQLMSQAPQQQQVPSTAIDINMQHLQQLMMQQQMLMQMQQNPQGMAMMMQQPLVYGMVPVAAASSMQPTVPTDGIDETEHYCLPTPESPKVNGKHLKQTQHHWKENYEMIDAAAETSPSDVAEGDSFTKSKFPFKMLSQGSSQNNGKSIKYSSYIMSAKREFARKEAQKSQTNSNMPLASVAPNVVETEQRLQSNAIEGNVGHQYSESEKSKVIGESLSQDKYPPEAVVQPMPQVALEDLENVTHEKKSDTDHATIATAITASTITSTTVAVTTSLTTDTEVAITFTTPSEVDKLLAVEGDTNKQLGIPQACIAPVPAAKPPSRGPARRISLKTERDREVAKVGNVGNVTKFRQMFGGGDH